MKDILEILVEVYDIRPFALGLYTRKRIEKFAGKLTAEQVKQVKKMLMEYEEKK